MTTTRTDLHCPSAFVPAHYEEVLAYNCATSQDGWPVPSWRVICEGDCSGRDGDCCTVNAARRAHAAGKQVFGSPGKCGTCGAFFIYGELWRHLPTGDLVHLGHTCASNYGLMMDRSDAELAAKRTKTAVATQIRRAANAEARAAFLANHPGLAEAFEVGNAESTDRSAQIIADIAARFVQFTSISDKQVDLVIRLADRIRNPPPPRVEDVPVPAPLGKVEFQGTIVSAKLRETFRGDSVWKVVIRVQTDAGAWKCYGTCPVDVLRRAVEIVDHEAPRATDRADAISKALRGMAVDIKATLELGRAPNLDNCETDAEVERAKAWKVDPAFVFMVRPVGYQVACHHPMKSTKRLKAEAAFAKLMDEERSAIIARDLGRYIIPHREVVISLAVLRGVTLSDLIAAAAAPAKSRAKRAG